MNLILSFLIFAMCTVFASDSHQAKSNTDKHSWGLFKKKKPPFSCASCTKEYCTKNSKKSTALNKWSFCVSQCLNDNDNNRKKAELCLNSRPLFNMKSSSDAALYGNNMWTLEKHQLFKMGEGYKNIEVYFDQVKNFETGTSNVPPNENEKKLIGTFFDTVLIKKVQEAKYRIEVIAAAKMNISAFHQLEGCEQALQIIGHIAKQYEELKRGMNDHEKPKSRLDLKKIIGDILLNYKNVMIARDGLGAYLKITERKTKFKTNLKQKKWCEAVSQTNHTRGYNCGTTEGVGHCLKECRVVDIPECLAESKKERAVARGKYTPYKEFWKENEMKKQK